MKKYSYFVKAELSNWSTNSKRKYSYIIVFDKLPDEDSIRYMEKYFIDKHSSYDYADIISMTPLGEEELPNNKNSKRKEI